MFVYISAACGIIIAVFGIIFLRPIAVLLGAEGVMLENCVVYGRIILFRLPAYMLQYEFQSFFVTAGKPQLGLTVTIISEFPIWCLTHCWWRCLISTVRSCRGNCNKPVYRRNCAGNIFSVSEFSLLRLTKTKFYGRSLLVGCINGSSELMSNISMSLIGMLL